MQATIVARGLVKRFGEQTAVDGIDLEVAPGRVCALLGPNGSGKTTSVRMLTTLLRMDGGEASVAGFDVRRQPARVRAHVGLVGQSTAVDEVLDGRQNLELFARLHHMGARPARSRAAELLERFGLADAGTRPVAKYSGGMRRRLDLAASLVLSPPVLFLDEPTTGLDPAARAEVWSAIRALVDDGTTVLLTTQYLEEADRLAHSVVVLDRGQVAAAGTPNALKARVGGDQVEVTATDETALAEIATILERAAGAPAQIDRTARRVSAPVDDRLRTLGAVLHALEEAAFAVEDVALRRPTLDEVFLQLTGREREEVPA